jgi:hypothetical protein
MPVADVSTTKSTALHIIKVYVLFLQYNKIP